MRAPLLTSQSPTPYPYRVSPCTSIALQWEALSACVLVFDVTSRSSFMACSRWLSLVRQRAATPGRLPNVVLVGNRTDLSGRRAVTRDEAVDWAMGEEIEYFETSAVRHHISIDLCLPFFTPPHARIISLSLSLSLCLSFSNAFPRFFRLYFSQSFHRARASTRLSTSSRDVFSLATKRSDTHLQAPSDLIPPSP